MPVHARIMRLLAITLTVLLTAERADALKISDVSHLKGRRINKLTGLGLVTGLRGTGDGNNSAQATRGLAAFLEKFGAPVLPGDQLDLKNIAIVHLSVTLPDHGIREGDPVNVDVSAIGGAKSIDGGLLMLAPLLGPPAATQHLFALASGRVVTGADTPNLGRIRGGAVMERDVIHHYIASGAELIDLYTHNGQRPDRTGIPQWLDANQRYFTLLIDDTHASWAMAQTIALNINQEHTDNQGDGDPGDDRTLAAAHSPREVIVTIPIEEGNLPARFIRSVQEIDLLMPPVEARVTINRTKGTIIVSGDVEISPVGITVRGLSITTAPAPAATGPVGAVTGQPTLAAPPEPARRTFMALDPLRQGGTKLANLIAGLNQLQVDTDQQIDVIEELHRAGHLHAKLMFEE